jgi:hypothetical protein
MMQKQKYLLLVIITCICGSVVSYQYETQRDKHERLASYGVKTQITAGHFVTMGTDYARFFFITKQGLRIDGSEKCGDSQGYEQYVNATVIYNPRNPQEYEFSSNFNRYSVSYRIMFFFFIYLPIMIFVAYNFLKFIITSYLKAKG